MKNFFNLFSSSKKINKNNAISAPNDTFIDAIICLNKNCEIDIKLFFDDNLKNKKFSKLEYSIMCAEFLHILLNGKIKTQILDIIINQIKNIDNKELIDQILKFLLMMEEKNNNSLNDDTPMIKPSQAFSRYKNG